MMNFKQLLLHVNARPFIDQARFGIEQEGQRVDLAGNLAKPIIQQSLAIDPITPISKQILAKHKQK